MTILLTPFMSCSAKIPIYSVFAAAFFPGKGGLVMFSLYLLGILVSILAAKVMDQEQLSRLLAKRHSLIGWALVILGLYGLWQAMANYFSNFLSDLFGIDFYRLVNYQLPKLVTFLLVIALGIWFIRGPKHSADDEFTGFTPPSNATSDAKASSAEGPAPSGAAPDGSPENRTVSDAVFRMVPELRGRPLMRRSRRERPSKRRSVLALSKAASARECAKQGGTAAFFTFVLDAFASGAFFVAQFTDKGAFLLCPWHSQAYRRRSRPRYRTPASPAPPP